MKRPEELLPSLVSAVPGPRSRELASRLARVECADTTYLAPDFPVFWEKATGSNVWDVDGNRFVDLTAAFGVCSLGHAHPELQQVLLEQARTLVHAMGDVHPAASKVRLLEMLARVAPGDLNVVQLGSSGSDAIEAALKTALRATGRPGALAFEGAYHGLGYGALSLTWRDHFRGPFRAQLNPAVRHLPYPGRGSVTETQVLEELDGLLHGPAGDPVGAVFVESIQGRGGVLAPSGEFLRGLRQICDARGRLLVVDEILTGLGRTGSWFACEHAHVVPDLLCVGKSLAGGLPLSACIGRAEVMDAWERSRGEARHTQTFLGNPLACAVACKTLEILERDEWPQRVAQRGAAMGREMQGALGSLPGVQAIRGRGFLWGVELVTPEGLPDGRRAAAIVQQALRKGFLLLVAGEAGQVLEILPPFVLGPSQWQEALSSLQQLLARLPPGKEPL